jgi:hypothetical protein
MFNERNLPRADSVHPLLTGEREREAGLELGIEELERDRRAVVVAIEPQVETCALGRQSAQPRHFARRGVPEHTLQAVLAVGDGFQPDPDHVPNGDPGLFLRHPQEQHFRTHVEMTFAP